MIRKIFWPFLLSVSQIEKCWGNAVAAHLKLDYFWTPALFFCHPLPTHVRQLLPALRAPPRSSPLCFGALWCWSAIFFSHVPLPELHISPDVEHLTSAKRCICGVFTWVMEMKLFCFRGWFFLPFPFPSLLLLCVFTLQGDCNQWDSDIYIRKSKATWVIHLKASYQ